MEQGEQDKSELPTPFKLLRAREKGSVARGMDLGFLTGLSAFLVYAWINGADFGQKVADMVRIALGNGPAIAADRAAVIALIPSIFNDVAISVALMVGTMFVVTFLFELLQTGIVFSAQPLKPDFGRLNPAKGLKRLFAIRLLVETFKNILKLCVYTAICWLVLRDLLVSNAASISDARILASLLVSAGFRLLFYCVLAALFFAVVDQLIVRRDFQKRMRMSRREVRREHRDREGEPRLKQKRKQLHGEFVKASQSLRGLRGADVLITNPQHIAMALRYERQTMQAPVIVAIGRNAFAQRLKRLAFIYGIPTFENRPLAQQLLATGSLSQPIPDSCFQAVADIYNALGQRRATIEEQVQA